MPAAMVGAFASARPRPTSTWDRLTAASTTTVSRETRSARDLDAWIEPHYLLSNRPWDA